ncbi:MAG: DUF4386 domain-containing protein [Kineosporiaceae bacterium]
MDDLRTIGRTTGAWYLALAVIGMLGFLLVRPAIVADGDPAQTLANLTDREALARVGVLLEMGIVAAQALAAVWFYRLFRGAGAPWAGFAVAAFGLMNAAAIMASGAFMATAVAVAGNPALAPGGDEAATVGLLFELSTNSWAMGTLFFGFWLIPMGWAALSTRRFPRVLGWILVVGGVGYAVSGFVALGLADPPAVLVEALTILATVGEFWMIAYLLVRGIRPEPAGPREHERDTVTSAHA